MEQSAILFYPNCMRDRLDYSQILPLMEVNLWLLIPAASYHLRTEAQSINLASSKKRNMTEHYKVWSRKLGEESAI